MNITEFLKDYIDKSSDPLKNNPERKSIRAFINIKLIESLSKFRKSDLEEVKSKQLGIMFSLLKYKYGELSYAYDYNKIFSSKSHKDITLVEIQSIITNAADDE